MEEATGSNARVQQEATEGQRKPTEANEKQPKATKSNRKQPKATKSNENRCSDQCDGARSPGGPRQRKNVFFKRGAVSKLVENRTIFRWIVHIFDEKHAFLTPLLRQSKERNGFPYGTIYGSIYGAISAHFWPYLAICGHMWPY